MSCLFCDIVSGDIPAKVVYEDDKVIGFLDINPVSLGHTLFIPKTHADDALSSEDQGAVFEAAAKYAARIKDILGAEGFNLLSNVGEEAGQSVFHFHVHVIPRYLDKSKDQLHYEFGSIGPTDLDAVQELLIEK